MHAPHLQTLHTAARTLVGPQPLAERLRELLLVLQRSIPFIGARVIVLEQPAWSLSLPPHDLPLWPQVWTSELLRVCEPLIRTPSGGAQYLGWPICWDGQLLGALELLVPPAHRSRDDLPLLDALTPLLSSALVLPMVAAVPVTALAAPPPPPPALAELRTALEAPLLVEPLVQIVRAWTERHLPAERVVLHVGQDQDNLRVHFSSAPANALLPATPSLAAAQQAIAQAAPLLERTSAGLEYALPFAVVGAAAALVVAGPRLGPEHVALLAQTAAVITPALQRALVYQRLHDQSQQLQHIFADLPTGLALTDHDGYLLRANPAWARLWNVPSTAVQPAQLVPWDMYEALLNRLPDPLAFDQFFRQPATTLDEVTLTLQMPYQLLRLLRIPIADAGRPQPHVLLVLSDVTRESEAERAKSEFVSVVSHELRTPLTSILGYADLLKARDFPPAERWELMDIIWKQASHLSNLVEDLLNVSRLDAGRITLNRWVLSLRQLITELITQMNKQLDQERHHLLLDIPATLPPVYADRDRLRQVLGNLLSNAIKYSPGGGEIVLRAQILHTPPIEAPSLPAEPALLITVRDEGMGMEAGELHRIFERFYRIDNGNTRKIGGSGLGLSITKALVELHGGRIWATSQPGIGSTFAFTIPIATDVVRTKN